MRFFFDRNIAPRLAHGLAGFYPDDGIVHQDDDKRFTKDSKDVFIIQTLAQQDPPPVFLTCDLNMRRKYPDERKALANSGLSVVFLKKNWNNLPFPEQARKIITAWPSIIEATEDLRIPTAFEITVNGKIERLGPISNL